MNEFFIALYFIVGFLVLMTLALVLGLFRKVSNG